MSMLDTFTGRRTPPKIDVPDHIKNRNNGHTHLKIEEQIADIGKQVLAARERGDRAVVEAQRPASIALPPTASNIFAVNALNLLNQREVVLNKALMLAADYEMLAGENIACGARTQDFMMHMQALMEAISEARPKVVEALRDKTPEAESPPTQSEQTVNDGAQTAAVECS